MKPPRFIPTYVGHTPVRVNVPSALPVHPHIRGAYPPAVGWSLHLHGSSPHTWGIRANSGVAMQYDRFIPTYVGHTRAGDFLLGRWAVHPHIRGAYALGGVAKITDARFIPTYVGHTFFASRQ